ncbi:MAG: hypothetical protein PHE43_00325 [Candidatus Nanoarchaeia archaeon]|nr:hypothetical protein [Candidatus Nanoarchaeia archaeon]
MKFFRLSKRTVQGWILFFLGSIILALGLSPLVLYSQRKIDAMGPEIVIGVVIGLVLIVCSEVKKGPTKKALIEQENQEIYPQPEQSSAGTGTGQGNI